MASIAASPVCPNGLKKRSRLNESLDLIRNKRQRCVVDTNIQHDNNDDADVAKYSQRHVEYFEHMKQAEIARIKTECDQLMMKKELDFQRLAHELQSTQNQVTCQTNEMVRLEGENRLLKRAVAIQNQQKEEVLQENKTLKQLATQAAEHMKRLEQANYTLRVHLQANTRWKLEKDIESADKSVK
ncbi:hypothetical protein DD238_001294 [Peronospora effusa]|uniref:Uncharacterized protein n=1 Tax=Peronospora effusa TaxID=542832 RepID=A0A3M6VMT4_9STRA|nr:hypothetical protein DD238_001294 [Peronospora effusa]